MGERNGGCGKQKRPDETACCAQSDETLQAAGHIRSVSVADRKGASGGGGAGGCGAGVDGARMPEPRGYGQAVGGRGAGR